MTNKKTKEYIYIYAMIDCLVYSINVVQTFLHYEYTSIIVVLFNVDQRAKKKTSLKLST